jgi:hypothetical protein
MLVRHRFLPHRISSPRRVAALLGMILLVGASAPALAQEYTDFRQLGTSNAVSKPGPSSGEELKAIFKQYRSDYEKVLSDTAWPGNPEDLFRAIENGQFGEAHYPVGHTFEWMTVRKHGVAQATGRLRWAGADPFKAFEIRFESNGQEHRFLIPKACGNLALVEMREARPAFDLPGLEPQLRVQATNSCTGANVTADVTIPGGLPAGTSLELTVTWPNGQSETLNPTQTGHGYRWEGKLDDAGAYTFSATVDTPIGRTETTIELLNLEPCQPTCNLQLTPPPMDPTPKRGKSSLSVDMCLSAARAGSLTSKTVQIFHTPVDGPEQLVETMSLDAECSASYLMLEYGTYRLAGEVHDDRGMSSTCQADYTLVQPERKLEPFFTVFGGNERRWRAEANAEALANATPEEIAANAHFLFDRSAPLLGGTVGISYPFADGGASVFGQGGVAINLRDNENTSIFTDIGVDKNFEGGFIGGGVGIWDINNGDTRDGTIFVHGGFNLSEKVQFNIEGRLFMDMLDMTDNNFVYLGGIRYFWIR